MLLKPLTERVMMTPGENKKQDLPEGVPEFGADAAMVQFDGYSNQQLLDIILNEENGHERAYCELQARWACRLKALIKQSDLPEIDAETAFRQGMGKYASHVLKHPETRAYGEKYAFKVCVNMARNISRDLRRGGAPKPSDMRSMDKVREAPDCPEPTRNEAEELLDEPEDKQFEEEGPPDPNNMPYIGKHGPDIGCEQRMLAAKRELIRYLLVCAEKLNQSKQKELIISIIKGGTQAGVARTWVMTRATVGEYYQKALQNLRLCLEDKGVTHEDIEWVIP